MTGQSVLITGCSDGGIGSGLAIAFQKRGFHVFATARDKLKMKSVESLPNVTLLELDVAKTDDIQAAVSVVAKMTGDNLDVLVNNAGRNSFTPVLDDSLDHIRSLFQTNLFGPIEITQAFAPLLIKSKGQAVYITSISGHVHVPFMGTYAASKRGLEIVAETLRLELEPFGVNVLEVITGPVQSQGQTYFEDHALPKESLYKSIESIVVSRAQGKDGYERWATSEYAETVLDEVAKRTPGKFWCGKQANSTKIATSGAMPQEALDALVKTGTGLDTLGPGN